MKSWMIFLSVIIFSTACSKSKSQYYQAPTIESEIGLITKCAAESEVQELVSKYSGQFRIINKKEKIYEIRGINKESILSELPNIRIKSNKFYNSLVPQASISQVTATNTPYSNLGKTYQRQDAQKGYFPHLEMIDGFELSSKGEGVTIAIVDTGVHYQHPHLNQNIKINLNESNGSNGLDTDGNGKIDDRIGWDFVNYDAYPNDDNGHGTHVAGLAAGSISGIAPMAKILPIKVLNANGSGDIATIAAGIFYAIEQGADVINLSLGGEYQGEITRELQSLFNSIKIANDNGIAIVAAAGNGGDDGIGDCNDTQQIFPANSTYPNVVSVASVNSYGSLSSFSNWGSATVDIAAPGEGNPGQGLYSTYVEQYYSSTNSIPYAYLAGTSMATPVVSGLFALVKSVKKDWDASKIKEIIYESADTLESLEGRVRTGKIINARKAVELALQSH